MASGFYGQLQYNRRPSELLKTFSLIFGSQLKTWHMLKTRFNLVDAFQISHTFRGTCFTKRSTHGNRLDQSRIDKFYLSDYGFWIHAIHKLEHVQDQTLLDHDPIILKIQIDTQNSTLDLKKTAYFQSKLSLLKREGTMDALWATWIAHPFKVFDPTWKFTLAWNCLKKMLKTIQEQVIATDHPLNPLLSQLY